MIIHSITLVHLNVLLGDFVQKHRSSATHLCAVPVSADSVRDEPLPGCWLCTYISYDTYLSACTLSAHCNATANSTYGVACTIFLYFVQKLSARFVQAQTGVMIQSASLAM